MAHKNIFQSPPKLNFVQRILRSIRLFIKRAFFFIAFFFIAWIFAYKWINPPTTLYMQLESYRRGGVKYEWVDLDQISPIMVRAVVASEDSGYCNHWGIEFSAIRHAWADGALRGGSTISQQTVKNAFLWIKRSWVRKGAEAVLTPFADWIWGKERTIEIYLNIIEFDTGVFGIQAAAQHHFGVDAAQLTPLQAARLAAVLPSPQRYSAVDPSYARRNRADSILKGAQLIHQDGRAGCFQS